MANVVTPRGAIGSGASLSVATALRLAWLVWGILLVIPFLMSLFVVWVLEIQEPLPPHPTNPMWFMTACIYLLLAVPASFFWRGHVFKAYWTGQTISPGKYLWGMISVWMALEIGGLFSLSGCLVDGALLPNLLPALVAFMFYVTLWPTGRAMVRPVGHHDDAQLYQEPR